MCNNESKNFYNLRSALLTYSLPAYFAVYENANRLDEGNQNVLHHEQRFVVFLTCLLFYV